MDINPIGISKGKPHALDARIIIDPKGFDPTSQYPHLVLSPYPSRYVVPWRLTDGQEITLRPIRPEDEPLEYGDAQFLFRKKQQKKGSSNRSWVLRMTFSCVSVISITTEKWQL
jgi:acetyltransferase